MKRSLCFCWIAIATVTAGCVSPPVVSLADADPAAIGVGDARGTLAALPNRLLLDEYRKSTNSVAANHDGELQPLAALPRDVERVALRQATLQPTEQATGLQSTIQRFKPIQEISLDIAPPALVNEQQQPIPLPQDDAAEALPILAQDRPFTRGDLVAAGYEWHPSPDGLEFCYQPLYFEEVNLERYGRSFGVLQPAVSAVAFYGRIPLLPYMAFARPARRCTMHAHWTLPGYKISRWEPQPIVPSIHGAAAEVAVLYGIILLIP